MSGAEKCLLLVEDEPIVALAGKRQLQRAGYRVVHVQSGEKAIEAIRRADPWIDLVLMDIDLGPGIDGTEAAREILTVRDLPIVFLSSHTEREYVEKTDQISSYGYVAKNSGEMVLLRSITMAFRLFEANRKLKASYEEISRSERRYRSLFENLNAGFALHQMIYDADGRAVDYRFLDVNPAFERVTGLDAPSILGRTVREVLPRTEQHWIEAYASVLETGQPIEYQNYSHELQRYYRVLAFRHLDDQFAVVLHDITENIRAKRELEMRTSELGERVRELHCLHQVAHLISHPTRTLPQTLVRIAAAIPSGFQRPEAVRARIVLDDEVYGAVCEAPLHTTHYPVTVEDRQVGSIVVDWCGSDSPDSSSFAAAATNPLDEEHQMMQTVALEVGRLVHGARTAARLRESERFLHSVFESVQDGITVLTPDLTVERVNGAVKQWFPSGRELVGSKCYEVYRGRNEPCVHCPVARSVRSGRPERAELYGYAASPVQWIEAFAYPVIDPESGAVVRVVEFMRDITQRKIANAALAESERRFQLALQSTGAAVWDWDMQHDIIRHSANWKSMLGYTDAEVESSSAGWQSLWHPDDAETVRSAMEDYLAGRSAEYEVVYRLRHKSGQWRWVLTRGTVLRHDNGEPYRWLGANIDITEQKRVEEALRTTADHNRTLMRELQHRVKNNLAIVAGMLDIEASKMSDPAVGAALADARSRIQTITEIYDQLHQRGGVERVDLGAYLDGLTPSVVRSAAGRAADVSLRTEFAALETDVQSAIAVGLIVNELVTNALKYAYPHGSGGELYVGLLLRGNEASRHDSLIVADEGVGLPPGVTVEGASTTGFQLVRSLAEQLGGSVAVSANSDRGAGSTDAANHTERSAGGTRITVTFNCALKPAAAGAVRDRHNGDTQSRNAWKQEAEKHHEN